MLEVLRPFAWDSLRWAGGFVFGFWVGINLSKSREGLATREVLSIESKITFFFCCRPNVFQYDMGNALCQE